MTDKHPKGHSITSGQGAHDSLKVPHTSEGPAWKRQHGAGKRGGEASPDSPWLRQSLPLDLSMVGIHWAFQSWSVPWNRLYLKSSATLRGAMEAGRLDRNLLSQPRHKTLATGVCPRLTCTTKHILDSAVI